MRRRRLRDRAIAYRGGRCTLCGYNKCSAALVFHHPDPLGKDFTISSRMTSWKAIVRELDKCDLVCANCHAEIHDGLHPEMLDEDGRFID